MMKYLGTPGTAALLAVLILAGCGGGSKQSPAPAPGPVTPPGNSGPVNPPGNSGPVTPPGNPAPVIPPVTPSPGLTDADRAAVPRAFDAQAMSASDVYLTWQDASGDETGFQIERLDDGGAWVPVTTVPANAIGRRIDKLQAGTTYTFRVAAIRPNVSGAASAPVTLRTPPAAQPAVFFVDAVNGVDINPGTEQKPWRTIQKASDTVGPGATVLVRAGTYRSNAYTIVAITRSGTPDAWITYKNYPGERPKLRSTYNANHHAIDVHGASYIVIDGFEIEGHLSEITPAVAQEENDWAKANPTKFVGPKVDSNGISVSGRGTVATPHHIIIRNNIVHDVPGGGINAIESDYVTIEYNRIYNTSLYSPYGTSGISYLISKDIDSGATGYKQIVRGNIVSEARNLFPCKCFDFKQPTDGNGIIIDTLTSFAYQGKTLVTNNLVFNNGGRGIHVMKSNNVDVFFNTAVRNSTIAITGDGEITVQNAANVRVYDNIMVANGDRPANLVLNSSAIDYNHNLVFGGNRFTGTGGTFNRLGVDPLFAPGAGVNAYFLRSDSPAANSSGSGVANEALDVFRAPRARGARADVGAVESI